MKKVFVETTYRLKKSLNSLSTNYLTNPLILERVWKKKKEVLSTLELSSDPVSYDLPLVNSPYR